MEAGWGLTVMLWRAIVSLVKGLGTWWYWAWAEYTVGAQHMPAHIVVAYYNDPRTGVMSLFIAQSARSVLMAQVEWVVEEALG